MRILLVHNTYQQRGGEDEVVANEAALLRDAGHEVELLSVSNDGISGALASARAALGVVYSRRGRALVAEAIARMAPDIVHVHNHFPLISPSLFDATGAAGVPSVWTLHNYRVACANGLLFRDGRPCEDCLQGTALRPVLRRCYRNSAPGSAAVAAMIGYHRRAGTWRTKVSRFIALSEFSRGRFEAAGLPAERLRVKPNMVAEPAVTGPERRSGFVFVGRLSPEKGIETLVRAWCRVDAPLTIIGDGPERVRLRLGAPANVRFAGHLPRAQVHQAIAGAKALIAPSLCYENGPVAPVEAMALGTPVLASRRGALAETIEDGVSGHLFGAGDEEDLARAARRLIADPAVAAKLGAAARRRYEARHAPARNLEMLLDIYRDALDEGRPSRRAA